MSFLPLLVAALAMALGVGGGVAFLIGLLGGLLARLLTNATAEDRRRAVAAQWARPLLQLGTIGLGASITPARVLSLGARGIGLTLLGIVVALVVARRWGRRWRLDSELALLLGAGTAICGASAIAAVSNARRSPAAATGAALGVVLLLNAVALFVYPWLGNALHFSDSQFGAWCALAIHDTSSVIGAAQARSVDAVAVATTLKLVRALWIVPLTLVLQLRTQRLDGSAVDAKRTTQPLWLLAGFVAVLMIAALLGASNPLVIAIAQSSRRLLGGVLLLCGWSVDLQIVRRAGLRPLALGVLLAVTAATVSGVLVKLIY